MSCTQGSQPEDLKVMQERKNRSLHTNTIKSTCQPKMHESNCSQQEDLMNVEQCSREIWRCMCRSPKAADSLGHTTGAQEDHNGKLQSHRPIVNQLFPEQQLVLSLFESDFMERRFPSERRSTEVAILGRQQSFSVITHLWWVAVVSIDAKVVKPCNSHCHLCAVDEIAAKSGALSTLHSPAMRPKAIQSPLCAGMVVSCNIILTDSFLF